MTDLTIPAARGDLPGYLATPQGDRPWPGVVVVHDAMGMTRDLRNQADWLAGAGYLAMAPDLYRGGRKVTCLVSFLRDASGPLGDLDATRAWLAGREDCTGTVGVIGFCLGGGFALMSAPGHGFAAASVNYGPVPKNAERALAGACPIVGSYGARDRGLRGAAGRLDRALSAYGVEHDVKEYPDVGHAFLNDHDAADVALPPGGRATHRDAIPRPARPGRSRAHPRVLRCSPEVALTMLPWGSFGLFPARAARVTVNPMVQRYV